MYIGTFVCPFGNGSGGPGLALQTVTDYHDGSVTQSEPNHHQTRGPGRQYSPTTNSGLDRWIAPNPAELGRLSVGCSAGPCVHSYYALAFAVGELYFIKIT
jgi:hypothetical protein